MAPWTTSVAACCAVCGGGGSLPFVRGCSNCGGEVAIARVVLLVGCLHYLSAMFVCNESYERGTIFPNVGHVISLDLENGSPYARQKEVSQEVNPCQHKRVSMAGLHSDWRLSL